MKLTDIETTNARTLADIRAHKAKATHAEEFRYYGYYEVDLFECPPFLMYTNNDCPRAVDILLYGNFEPMSMLIWCRLARTASCIIDVGAHVGVYSLAAAAMRKDIAIHSFEPNPYAFTRLSMHKEINGFSNISDYTFALGNETAMVMLSWNPKSHISTGATIIPGEGNKAEHIVQMRDFDSLGICKTIDDQCLMKIDVEGAELATFGGMRQTLERRPDIILETFDERACSKVNAMIKPLGYNVFQIFEAERMVVLSNELIPADRNSQDFNQLLTVKSPSEINALMS
jgi:FkbM family methyltransferase